MWVCGIPGAGKTILCSTIIEHIHALNGPGSANQHAYFYFDFSDPEKQTVVGMLRSVIAQLCSHKTQLPAELDALYLRCQEGKQQPGEQSLIQLLLCLVASSSQTYLMMDALDECVERQNLLDLINRTILPSRKVNLVVTSREERDMTESFQETMDATVSLEGREIDGDINLYVHECLSNDTIFQKWPTEIKREVQMALVHRADGMYICWSLESD